MTHIKFLCLMVLTALLTSCSSIPNIENISKIKRIQSRTPQLTIVNIKDVITNGEKWIYLAENSGMEFYIRPANNPIYKNNTYGPIIEKSKNYLLALIPPKSITVVINDYFESKKVGGDKDILIYTATNIYDDRVYRIDEHSFEYTIDTLPN